MLSTKNQSTGSKTHRRHTATEHDWSLEAQSMLTCPPDMLSEIVGTKLYTLVPLPLLECICADEYLSDGAKNLWMYLFSDAARWPDWTIRRGVPALAKTLNVAQRTIQRRLCELEEQCFIVRESRYLDNRQLVNQIRVTIPYKIAQTILMHSPNRPHRRSEQSRRPESSPSTTPTPVSSWPSSAAAGKGDGTTTQLFPGKVAATASEATSRTCLDATGATVARDAHAHAHANRNERTSAGGAPPELTQPQTSSTQRDTPPQPPASNSTEYHLEQLRLAADGQLFPGKVTDDSRPSEPCATSTDCGASVNNYPILVNSVAPRGDTAVTPNNNTAVDKQNKQGAHPEKRDHRRVWNPETRPRAFIQYLKAKPVAPPEPQRGDITDLAQSVRRKLSRLGYSGQQLTTLVDEIMFSLKYQHWNAEPAKAANACVKLVRQNRWRTPAAMHKAVA